MSENNRYEDSQDASERAWERQCLRCGGCCGVVDNDPCLHLKQNDDGTYACDIYEHRFGLRTTVSGKKFHCVPIREILHTTWPGAYRCAYKKPSR